MQDNIQTGRRLEQASFVATVPSLIKKKHYKMEKSKNSNTNNEVPLTFLFTDSSVLLSVFQRGNWSQGVPDAALL